MPKQTIKVDFDAEYDKMSENLSKENDKTISEFFNSQEKKSAIDFLVNKLRGLERIYYKG